MTINENAAQEQAQHNDINQLTVYINHNEGKPIYITDNPDASIELIKQGVNYIFDLAEINKQVKELPSGAKRQGDNMSPVIILHDDSNGKARAQADHVAQALRGAGIATYKQSTNRTFKAITAAGSRATAQELAAQYRGNFSAAGTINEFKSVINTNANTPAIKTGFPILDEVLDGGLYEGLYAIGAISSLGKTTFCLNIAEQIAESGQDVIIISLEMGKYSLIGRSISRLTFIRQKSAPEIYDYSDCKTARGITDGSRYANYNPRERQLINEAIEHYTNHIGGNLYIYEAIGAVTAQTIRGIVKEHQEYTGHRPVLIIDYLQLIQHEDKYINGNDKIRTDFNLTELKQLSRDHKLPILLISSFNRAGYSTEVKLECFKESGGIDYTCDVIMGLQLAGVGGPDFDVNEAKAKSPREIELVFLKNREAAVGEMIKYYYFPMFNHFEESTEDVRAQRAYKKEQHEEAKNRAKESRAEAMKAEHIKLVNIAYEACQENGAALISEMVDFCGGKPTAATLTRYIKETGFYNIVGNKITRKF